MGTRRLRAVRPRYLRRYRPADGVHQSQYRFDGCFRVGRRAFVSAEIFNVLVQGVFKRGRVCSHPLGAANEGLETHPLACCRAQMTAPHSAEWRGSSNFRPMSWRMMGWLATEPLNDLLQSSTPVLLEASSTSD